jgi:hypothetical protein
MMPNQERTGALVGNQTKLCSVIPILGEQYVSHEIPKHKAEDDARKYAGGYAGPIDWVPVRFVGDQ